MRTVVNDPPELVERWLDERRARGQDLFDEVWEDVYHVAPAPHRSHGRVDHELVRILGPLADRAGLFGQGPLNVGQPDDYRVPDQAYTRDEAPAAFVPTAALVVEVVSPNDETWDKLEFWHARGVEEVAIADPRQRRVWWFVRGEDEFVEVDRSVLLAADVADVTSAVRWPPTT